MIELPNFSDTLQKNFRAFLDTSEKAYMDSLDIAKSEAVVYEFDFSIVDSLRGLSEICFLQSEYRSRCLNYKYANYQAEDTIRKLEILRNKKTEEGNDDLDDGLLRQEIQEGQDKWEESKENKETLTLYNYRLRSNKYLNAVVTTATARNDFMDK